MKEIWFQPNTPNAQIVGRFADHTQEWTDSKGEKQSRTLPYLYHRTPASLDISSTQCKPNAAGEKLKEEWSQAWAYYEKSKAEQVDAPAPIPTATEFGIKGTPIEEAEFIGKDRLAFLKSVGMLTLEQLADMSDAIAANISGGVTMRKKAKQHLAAKAAA